MLKTATQKTAIQNNITLLLLGNENDLTAEISTCDIKSAENDTDPLGLDYACVQRLSVCRNVLSETLRLAPVATFLTRPLQRDVVLEGHMVPAKVELYTEKSIRNLIKSTRNHIVLTMF